MLFCRSLGTHYQGQHLWKILYTFYWLKCWTLDIASIAAAYKWSCLSFGCGLKLMVGLRDHMEVGWAPQGYDPVGNRLTRNLGGNPITWSYDDL